MTRVPPRAHPQWASRGIRRCLKEAVGFVLFWPALALLLVLVLHIALMWQLTRLMDAVRRWATGL